MSLILLCSSVLMKCPMYTDPPNVTATPLVAIVNSSSTPFTFTCQAFGIPPPTITWTKGRANGNNGVDQQTVTGSVTTSTLTFDDPSDLDESNYTCSASNGITNVLSTPEQVTVIFYVQGTCLLSD